MDVALGMGTPVTTVITSADWIREGIGLHFTF
jgi:hypothetical protein